MTMKRTAIIESILFAAAEPVSLSTLVQATECSKSELREALESLQSEYAERGLRLVIDDRAAQLVTAPEAASHVARFLKQELRGRLSPGALETLAIIAYRGPATRPQVEAIRGVQSAQPLRTLAIRGLITDVGRTKEPGRPILYDTTLELLKHLGISSKRELPKPPEELTEKLAHAEDLTAVE